MSNMTHNRSFWRQACVIKTAQNLLVNVGFG